MKGGNVNSKFAAGFVSAALLLAGTALILQALIWFTGNHQPQAFAAYLKAPRFSFLDIFTALIGLLTVALLFAFMYWRPRA